MVYSNFYLLDRTFPKFSPAYSDHQKMSEKRKTESEPRDGDHNFYAKRARQQISYDDLDDSVHSRPVARPELTRNELEDDVGDASENEINQETNSKNVTTSNKQSGRQRYNQQPRVDPAYGQRSAFPGLDDAGSDELLYGPPEDGLEYLRLVR